MAPLAPIGSAGARCPTPLPFQEVLVKLQPTSRPDDFKAITDSIPGLIASLKGDGGSALGAPRDTSETTPKFRTRDDNPQGQKEKEYAKEISKIMNLSLQDGSLLLRDFLALIDSGSLDSAEEQDLRLLAPVPELENFWREQRKAMFSVVAELSCLAADHEHPLHPQIQGLSEVNTAFPDALVSVIENRVDSLTAYRPVEALYRERISLDLIWAIETLFVIWYETPADTPLVVRLIRAIDSFKTGRLQNDSTRAVFTNSSSLLITLTVIETFNLEIVTPSLQSTPLVEECGPVARSKEDMNSVLLALDSTADCAELNVIRLAFGTLGQLRKHVVDDECDFSRVAQRALNCDALTAFVRMLGMHPPPSQNSIEIGVERLKMVGAGFLSGFLCAYPPTRLEPDQLDLLAVLAGDLIRGSAELGLNHLLKESNLHLRKTGINLLMRFSSLYFPYQSRPLLWLLSSLAGDSRTAQAVFVILRQLGTVTLELPDSHKVSVHPYDPQITKNDVILEEAIAVCFGRQAPSELLVLNEEIRALFGVALPAGTPGLRWQSLVVYQSQWNGWHKVQAIVMNTQREVSRSSLSVSLPDNLVTVARASLDLLHRVSRYAPPDTTKYLLGEIVNASVLVDLVQNLVRLHDSSNMSTRSASLALLDLASKCLCLSVKASGSQTAKFALQKLSASVFGDRHSSLTLISLRGPHAFPLLTAHLRVITAACDQGVDNETHTLSLKFISQHALPAWLASAKENVYDWDLAAVCFQAHATGPHNGVDEALIDAVAVTIEAAGDVIMSGSPSYAAALQQGLAWIEKAMTISTSENALGLITARVAKSKMVESLFSLALDGSGFPDPRRSSHLSSETTIANRILRLLFNFIHTTKGLDQIAWAPKRGFRQIFASKIASTRRSDLLVLIEAAVSTGQRALSRSMLGPTKNDDQNSVLKATFEAFQHGVQNPTHPDSARLACTASALLCSAWNRYGSLWLESNWRDLGIWKYFCESLSKIPVDGRIEESDVSRFCKTLNSHGDNSADRGLDDRQALWMTTVGNVLQLIAISSGSTDEVSKDASMGMKDLVTYYRGQSFEEMIEKLTNIVDTREQWLFEHFARAETKVRKLAKESSSPMFTSVVTREFGLNYAVDVQRLAIDRDQLDDDDLMDIACLNIVYSRVHVVTQLSNSLSSSLRLVVQKKNETQDHELPSAVLARLIRLISRSISSPWEVEQHVQIVVVSNMSSILEALSSVVSVEELAAHDVSAWMRSLCKAIEWLAGPLVGSSRECDLALSALLASGTELVFRGCLGAQDETRLIAAVLQCLDSKDDRVEVAGSAGASLCRFAARSDSFRWASPKRTLDILVRLQDYLALPKSTELETEKCQSAWAVFLRLMLLTADASLCDAASVRESLGRLAFSQVNYNGTAYSRSTRERSSVYEVWIAQLALATKLIRQSGAENDDILTIAEYAGGVVDQVLKFSLHLLGDWPRLALFAGSSSPVEETIDNQSTLHITLARLEEAEVASRMLWALAEHSDKISRYVPNLAERMVHYLRLYVSHAYRLLRAEPIDRWVLPVSLTEINRAIQSNPARVSSPLRSPTGTTVRTVLGRYNSLPVPPSPKMPMTPASPSLMARFTPNSSTPGTGGTPASGPARSGLPLFSEDAVRSILEGVNSALAALRKIHTLLGEPVFEASMVLSSERPSIGLLVAMQLHACNEILHRSTDGKRRDALFLLFDNAMCLIVGHVVDLMAKGTLGVGARDELRKRLSTMTDKLRRAVPPPPSGSSVLRPELDEFLSSMRPS